MNDLDEKLSKEELETILSVRKELLLKYLLRGNFSAIKNLVSVYKGINLNSHT